MKRAINILTGSSLLLCGHLSAQAQDNQPVESRAFRLAGRHAISISVGYMTNPGNGWTFTGGNRVEIDVSSEAVGWIGYRHWFGEEWAIQVESGGMASHMDMAAGFGQFSTETSTIVPFLFGARYQPQLGATSSVRPYLAALAGPYTEFSTRAGTGPFAWEGSTRTTLGARFGAGVDVLAGRRFAISTGLRYHALGDFDWPGETRENYSGLELALGFSILFGHPR